MFVLSHHSKCYGDRRPSGLRLLSSLFELSYEMLSVIQVRFASLVGLALVQSTGVCFDHLRRQSGVLVALVWAFTKGNLLFREC